MPDAFVRFIDTLRTSRVFIQTHDFPDQDAIVSAYGLQKILLHFGVDANLCCMAEATRIWPAAS